MTPASVPVPIGGITLTPTPTVVAVGQTNTPSPTPSPQLTNTPTPSPSPTTILTSTTQPLVSQPTPVPVSAKVEAEWPYRMILNESSSVRASLVYRDDMDITPTLEDDSNVGRVAPLNDELIPPGMAIPDALGDGYNTRITASLVGSAFEIEPLNVRPYSLRDREEVTWDWSVTPRQAGERELLLVVEVEWIPRNEEEGEPLLYQIGRERLEVVVEQPLVIFGESIAFSEILVLMITAIISGTIGFFLPRLLKLMTRSPGD
jgi:hypothetical protein